MLHVYITARYTEQQQTSDAPNIPKQNQLWQYVHHNERTQTGVWTLEVAGELSVRSMGMGCLNNKYPALAMTRDHNTGRVHKGHTGLITKHE